ncbi:hypothetical protein CRI94_11455 [Longibacter salinarum]|uniref:Uncharacterized protein n=1 Tax=Longibacter salinarum TaxID=1850348 RepID=A0A2A8CWY2_9BACT|nr:hypothetical protein [Longibacter salinarum]PEN13249.1 hypothetical protein CRI94_11455 [Longibacter salinarum]
MTDRLSFSPLRLFALADSESVAHAFADAGVDAVIRRRPRMRDGAEGAPLSEWAAQLDVPLFIQIHRFHAGTGLEVERAIEIGASGIALPGAYSAGEVETLIRLVRNRAKTLIHVDLPRLLEEAEALRRLDWDHLHIGLHRSVRTMVGGLHENARKNSLIADVVASMGERSVSSSVLSFRPDGTIARVDLHPLREVSRTRSPFLIVDAPHTLPREVVSTWIRSIRRAWSDAKRPSPLPSPAEWDRSWASPPR